MSWYHDVPRKDDILTGDTVLLPDGTELTPESDRTRVTQGWRWFDTDAEAFAVLAPDAMLSLGQQLAAQQATIDALLEALGGGQ